MPVKATPSFEAAVREVVDLKARVKNSEGRIDELEENVIIPFVRKHGEKGRLQAVGCLITVFRSGRQWIDMPGAIKALGAVVLPFVKKTRWTQVKITVRQPKEAA